MAEQRDAIGAYSVLSRKHTADLLRQLRVIRNELRALKHRVVELETHDKATKIVGRFRERRRAG